VTDAPLVRCVGLGRSYGAGRSAVVALHGATCEISAGDRIALVGPSGSGKSTLLHLMAALEPPTTGEITWPALGARTSIRPGPVGIIFQGPSLIPPLNVVENVALPVLLEGGDDATATARAVEALARLGLAELAAKLPEELSGGQAQRVAVARVLAATPRLILADEPTGQLDHATASDVVDVLLDAATEAGAALLVSTHDPRIAVRLPHRWDITNGRLQVVTKPAPPSPGRSPCSR
jgi:ABC-type lipoprotein export system ATPase subunit